MLDDTENDDHGNLYAGNRLEMAYGDQADPADRYEDLYEHSSQLYSALCTLTEDIPFTYVDNAISRNVLEAYSPKKHLKVF